MAYNYLNKVGLTNLWGNIKAYITSKLSSKADDNSVVHLTGNEDINGYKFCLKDFGGKLNDFTRGTIPDINKAIGMRVWDTTNTSLAAMSYVARTDGSFEIRTLIYDANAVPRGYTYTSDNTFVPTTNNVAKLGTSSNKWSEVNATTFIGNLTGTANSAVSDNNGNNIVNTYATKTEVSEHAANTTHITDNERKTWNAKQQQLTTGQLSAVDSGVTSTKVTTYDSHIADTGIHVTSSDKTTWSGKQNALTTAQLAAANSRITSSKVTTYDAYAADISTKANSSDLTSHTTNGDIHVTSTERSNWNAKSNFSGSYADLTNKPTIPTVNNATLTIQKNGTTVKTFTANSSSNVTCNIEVPTKVSDLTNDSGFIADVSGKADKATTLNGYGITDAYTKTQVDKKVSDLVNSAPETLDTLSELATALGNDPNFATTIATQIGTKANDSDVVHTSGNETINGIKTFSSNIVGNVTGNASTATQFSTNKAVTLTGDVTGTASSKAGWSVATTLADSGVTVGTYGPNANVTGNNNSTILVPEITVDAKGRVTSVTNRTLTCKNDTYSVYDKTLMIQKNGTNVATFTSNSNTDVTANITVPTKVSELTNDSGFLTSHQSLSNYSTLDNTVKSLSISGKTITVTPGSGSAYTLTTQDTVDWSGIINKPTNFTPSSHTHGQLTNDGKIGTAASKPLITTTGGVVTTGSFGTAANTFCQGNDSRLSDARTPKAHTHAKSDITDFPTLATVATSGSYNDLSNKPAIPTVNNATLTIQKNGTTVNSFTANASSNVTANITVPTKTSDLTNDNGYITNTNDCVHLTGDESIDGTKTFNSGVVYTKMSSYAYNDVVTTNAFGGWYIRDKNGSNVVSLYMGFRVGDNANDLRLALKNKLGDTVGLKILEDGSVQSIVSNRNLGASDKLWGNVYATNFIGNATSATTATSDANGNVITDTYATKVENSTKANDSAVVHTSGTETINGTKTFSDVKFNISAADIAAIIV